MLLKNCRYTTECTRHYNTFVYLHTYLFYIYCSIYQSVTDGICVGANHCIGSIFLFQYYQDYFRLKLHEHILDVNAFLQCIQQHGTVRNIDGRFGTYGIWCLHALMLTGYLQEVCSVAISKTVSLPSLWNSGMLSPWTPTVWLKQTVGAVIQCQFHCFVTELRHHATMSIPLKRHILLTPSHYVNFIVSSYNYVTVKQRQFYCFVTVRHYRHTTSVILFRHIITSP